MLRCVLKFLNLEKFVKFQFVIYVQINGDLLKFLERFQNIILNTCNVFIIMYEII